jgi:hypothetical protein
MQFLAVLALLTTSVLAAGPRPNATPVNNANRPIPTGACCVSNTSLKQDVCNINGKVGRCVPANTAGCADRLTCIEDSLLTCDPTRQERGRELCQLR